MQNDFYMPSPILASHAATKWATPLDTPLRLIKNAGLAFNHASSFDRLNTQAGKPLYCGFFTSERLERPCVPVHAIVAPSMVGRGGEAFGLAGFLCASLSTLPRSRHLRLTADGGDLTPTIGAFIMPKLARIFLTYSLLAITVIAFERNTPLIVVALSFAAFCLAHVIGGARHD